MTEEISDPVSEAEAAFIFKRCEELGEDKARKATASNYFSPSHRRMAELWLRQQDEKRRDKISQKTMWAARRAEIAAWLAAVIALVAIFQASAS